MLYSQDGRGLGHLRRAHSISARIAEISPESTVLTVTDSPLGRFFESLPGHDFLKLPSVVKTGPGVWRPLNLPLPIEQVRGLRSDLLRCTAEHFRPDVILVDHMPHGAEGELLPALEALRAAGTRIVLGLRDILDAPHVVRRRWELEGAYAAVERYYDRVLVYGQRHIFDVADQYAFPEAAVDRLRYCGYLCTPRAPRYADRLRRELLSGEPPGTALVVAMAGGGADAHPLMSCLLDALPAVVAQRPCKFVLIAGPFMPVAQRRALEASARGADVPARVRISVSDTLSYIDAADVVVAMAGYNTTVEILRAGRPVVLVPRAGPSAEQRMRAQRFQAEGWVDAVEPEALGVESLAAAVRSALDRGRDAKAPSGPALDGLAVAVDELLAEATAPALDLRSVERAAEAAEVAVVLDGDPGALIGG